jgi:hypothetical protein
MFFLGAGALAGVPSLELLAQQYSWTFQEARRLQREGRPPDTETILRLRRETRAAKLVAWRRQLQAAISTQRALLLGSPS